MNLVNLLTAFKYEVTGGQEYCWDSFGPNAWFLDFGDNISIVFDRKNQTIYQVNWYPEPSEEDDDNDNFLQKSWINPVFLDAYLDECKARSFQPEDLQNDLDAFIKQIQEAEYE